MQFNTKSVRQVLWTAVLMTLGLFLVNVLGADIALAQISPGDQPTIISGLSGGSTELREVALKIINFFLGFLGILALIMVIYGGFLYVSSAGNQENTEKAKKILLYAAIGIIVIAVSFALVNTILGAATGQQR